MVRTSSGREFQSFHGTVAFRHSTVFPLKQMASASSAVRAAFRPRGANVPWTVATSHCASAGMAAAFRTGGPTIPPSPHRLHVWTAAVLPCFRSSSAGTRYRRSFCQAEPPGTLPVEPTNVPFTNVSSASSMTPRSMTTSSPDSHFGMSKAWAYHPKTSRSGMIRMKSPCGNSTSCQWTSRRSAAVSPLSAKSRKRACGGSGGGVPPSGCFCPAIAK
ncbi:MAG: hypothetical protein IKS67_07895 [Victivallales bacterium]|nr:hypothetical protein [Victivallales bacterium]